MLKFSKKTKWGDFLDAYLEATQRKPGLGRERVELTEDALPARRAVPLTKGGESRPRSIKNHPAV